MFAPRRLPPPIRGERPAATKRFKPAIDSAAAGRAERVSSMHLMAAQIRRSYGDDLVERPAEISKVWVPLLSDGRGEEPT